MGPWRSAGGGYWQTLAAIDSLLTATAIEHNLVLVTRKVKDFAALPVDLSTPGGTE